MLRIAKDKQRIWKRVTVRVVLEDGKGFTWRPCAGPGKGYTSENIQEVLEKCSDFLEKKYPNVEFRLVELEPNRFNLIHVEKLGDASGGMPLTCGQTEAASVQDGNSLSPQAQ